MRYPGKMRGSAYWAIALLVGAAACGGSDNESARKPAATNPVVEGPVTAGGGPECCFILGGGIDLRDLGYTPGRAFFSDVAFDIAEVGYQQREYFISGTATSYRNTAELESDGRWEIAPADTAPYKSRIVVHRPVDAADFNGTVIVEWFNVSGGLDAAPDWLQTQTELMRSGYIWVGISAQKVGIDGGGAFDIGLKTVDPGRYGSLRHPGDSFSYDIFSQGAQAVRNPEGIDPLEGLVAKRLIAVGQSQSAFRLVTYANAVHPTVELFDGFLIHSRGGSSAGLSQAPQANVPSPGVVWLRDDLPEPIITLQTETDIFGLGSLAIRQPDTDKLRLWEVAGSAHADIYTTLKSPIDRGDDPSVADVVAIAEVRPPFITCAAPANDGPGHWVAKAAISALDTWIRSGDPAAAAPLLAVNASETAFAVDEFGNTRGGIRTPYVDVPVARFSGGGQGSDAFCGLFGTTTLFDQETLDRLYPSNAAYVAAIHAATDAAVAAGFLLEVDAALIKTRAPDSGIGAPD